MERLLQEVLSRLVRAGNLTIVLANGRRLACGDGTGQPIVVRFADRGAQFAVLADPYLKLGELFMDGRLVMEQGSVYDLLELVLRESHGQKPALSARMLSGVRFALRRWKQRNRGARSKANVAHHYDLDAGLYDLFLDSDRQYSCAYFERPDMSLEEAQLAKRRHITSKLLIEPGQNVLDIGCGWGGLGLYLAEFTDADVVGVTLSEEQLSLARRRAQDRDLARRVEFRLQDYRAVPETFDRIVSVGMFEHVGVGYYDAFFSAVSRLLKKDGVALLHTIGRTDGPGFTNPWIDKYIFPGGYIPALSEVAESIQRVGLIVTDVEILHLHYAETLRHWRERFLARRDDARRLYDERFCRMWEFYLAASEATFRAGEMVNFQVQLVHEQTAVPMTRDYIAQREAELRARDGGEAPLRMAGE
ncbi:MAG TPA: cyclopropane-fatty-acyl-phospholipid synthase family protein [Hyphomicrobiales bacterium]|nr:cyclopropane-fatty-acyl-phospholipid synthase family protein [Hyphomicrobiales bacterium]